MLFTASPPRQSLRLCALALSLALLPGAAWSSTDDNKRDKPEALPEVLHSLQDRGVEIIGRLSTPGGLEAYAGIAQQQPLAVFLTPDGEHLIIGTMINAAGMDVTASPLANATNGPWSKKTWQALTDSTWVQDGDADAPRIIYMITDPNCPFCHKFWQQARPWVAQGRVQIRHVLVGVLTASSQGKAAAILQAEDPSQALHDHESAGPERGIPPADKIQVDTGRQLDANRKLMLDLQIQGTPGIFYFDEEGGLQIQRGAPLDENLEQILGPKP